MRKRLGESWTNFSGSKHWARLVMTKDSLAQAHEYLTSNGFPPSRFWHGDYNAAFYPGIRDDIGIVLLYRNNRLTVLGCQIVDDCVYASPIQHQHKISAIRSGLKSGLPEDVLSALRQAHAEDWRLELRIPQIVRLVEDEHVADLIADMPARFAVLLFQSSEGVTPKTATAATQLALSSTPPEEES